jgi:NAD(P)H-dependent flavin oxidoreductase YrpB (nitropropane dioxygenase family)
MQWIGRAELASAVSNAGGLGVLTGLTQPTPEDLRKEIRRCKEMTKYPFGVNITILPTANPPDYKAYARVVVEENIKIVETAGRLQEVLNIVKGAGCIVIHKCTTVRHAKKAESLGVDFISVDAFEAAGHIVRKNRLSVCSLNVRVKRIFLG